MTAHPGVPEVDRDAIAADLDACAEDLHALLASATPDRLSARSDGTKWTNEAAALPHGVRVPRRAPAAATGPPGQLSSAAGRAHLRRRARRGRVPFHWVNYAGSRGGALVFNHQRMGRLCDHTIDALTRRLRAEREDRLHRTMPFPTSWDPYFQPLMTLEDVYAYPVLHYRHHRAQLTLSG